MRMLLIEDDPSPAKSIKMILKSDGAQGRMVRFGLSLCENEVLEFRDLM
jgi:hypothetical protein